MPRTVLLQLLLIVALMTASTSAMAWGARGHRIIAALAQQQLTPAATAGITRLLGTADLASVATWADDMRSAQDNPAFWLDYANAWHFVNLPVNGAYGESRKNPQGDAVAALATFSAILLDQPLPTGPVQSGLRHYFGNADLHSPEVKRFALKFMIHVVADLHQPLHSGYASDRGGNDIKLVWLASPTNLHALWDSALLEYDERSEASQTSRLHKRLDHTANAEIRSMQSTDVSVWLQESSELLRRIHAYPVPGMAPASAYAAEFAPTVDSQLLKASVRTAYYLNSIFGQIHQ